ncbi:FliA/WhiG family RNA polymerase sigma factor [Dyella sp. M7H15-1]|uniref:FliA/WhiG family RNA polymerase sigma factor n=1 Tax=Dyella sp. M7H15-1 TaxID=2501295 RepID=UPI001004F981|nr:FliA/WhiG family RNA polymerase sigma factor [Dyella sp. M7H15-1]QAU24292.1 FliA/WhiG family RNA polymerase sigma factor [Dyella sp. M7H15-1]
MLSNTESAPAGFPDTDYTRVQRSAQKMSKAQEQRWLVTYAPLVKRVVRSLSSQVSGVFDAEDMEQIGLMGLLEALRRYGEPDEGFGSYASLRVRGAVLDELRRLDWRSRATRQSAHKLRQAERELRRKLGREPKREEVCTALDISAEQYDELELADNAQAFASFDEIVATQGDVAGMQASPEQAVIDQSSLAEALRMLDTREQQVIQLYYEYELSLSQIAQVLELTTARICQINKKALGKMRAFLMRD